MKRRFIFTMIIISVFMCNILKAQNNIYNPNADAKTDLANAIKKAKLEKKHVLIQVGYNACPWCIKFHKFIHENKEIDSLLTTNFIFLLINYSRENKNMELMKQFKFPQRFGFPVLLVLDAEGNLIHTQDTGLLELEKGYDPEKVKTFLKNWTVKALDPNSYLN